MAPKKFKTISVEDDWKDKLVIINRKACPRFYASHGYIYYIYRVKSIYNMGGGNLAECYPFKPLHDIPDDISGFASYERCNFKLKNILLYKATNKLYGSLLLDKEL